ncbi:hypothetical protein CSAL01_01461 [Colletotrichum salicis]|uniref:Uncharacterized protein n=1 Tax=Colletotrichum salicis TaxID=1209931 RepID=A0A135V8N3_9PEZI|nr:hypothetical protein CSAL01_01461 [Colletotrichum salicis]
MVLPDLDYLGREPTFGEETVAGSPMSRDSDSGESTLQPARDEYYCAIRVPKWDRVISDGLLEHYLQALSRCYTWRVLNEEDERRDADDLNGQQDEDVIMTDAPPIESDEGGIVDFNRYLEEIVSIIRRIEQLRIAPHQQGFPENAQVGEISEDVKMTNSDW